MQTKYSTEMKLIRIGFTNKKITVYGGFSPLSAFFEKIRLKGGILISAIHLHK